MKIKKLNLLPRIFPVSSNFSTWNIFYSQEFAYWTIDERKWYRLLKATVQSGVEKGKNVYSYKNAVLLILGAGESSSKPVKCSVFLLLVNSALVFNSWGKLDFYYSLSTSHFLFCHLAPSAIFLLSFCYISPRIWKQTLTEVLLETEGIWTFHFEKIKYGSRKPSILIDLWLKGLQRIVPSSGRSI